jgi:hypothetical protein
MMIRKVRNPDHQDLCFARAAGAGGSTAGVVSAEGSLILAPPGQHLHTKHSFEAPSTACPELVEGLGDVVSSSVAVSVALARNGRRFLAGRRKPPVRKPRKPHLFFFFFFCCFFFCFFVS